MNKLYLLLLVIISYNVCNAQVRKPINQPFADQKIRHLGFMIGFQAQDLIISHTGYVSNSGEAWFAEIPSYSAGFSVGIIGDQYLNEFFNLRLTPTLHFGERRFVFKEEKSGKEYEASLRSNYLSIPLHLKYSAARTGNFRPYFIGGGYAAINIGPKKDEVLRFKQLDYGFELGIGCNIYMPMFKLCPELKFSFGLTDIVNKDRSDLTDKDLLKYSEAISSGKTRMVSLIFNFE